MAILEEILNRDSRTTLSLSDKIKEIRSFEICENCDRLEQSRRQKYFIKPQKCIRSRFSTSKLKLNIEESEKMI